MDQLFQLQNNILKPLGSFLLSALRAYHAGAGPSPDGHKIARAFWISQVDDNIQLTIGVFSSIQLFLLMRKTAKSLSNQLLSTLPSVHCPYHFLARFFVINPMVVHLPPIVNPLSHSHNDISKTKLQTVFFHSYGKFNTSGGPESPTMIWLSFPLQPNF